jgi:hypothetical protein
MSPQDAHIHRILQELDGQPHLTQRSLATRVGIALGLTNLLLRRLAAKGWVRVVRFRGNRVGYLLTPRGLAEKARISRNFLQSSIKFYAEARDRIQMSFAMLRGEMSQAGVPDARIIFWGAGEMAEVGYVCLQDSNLTLVGTVDEQRHGRRFFGQRIHPPSAIRGYCLDGQPFHWVVVISLDDPDAIANALEASGVDSRNVFYV